jgi:hypothetical protein
MSGQTGENGAPAAAEGREPGTGRFAPGNKGGGRPAVSRRLRELCQQHADEAVAGLLREAREAEAPSARIAAWNAILDRGFGRPTVGEPDDEGRQAVIFQIITGIQRGEG